MRFLFIFVQLIVFMSLTISPTQASGTFDAFCVTGADLFVLQRKQEWPMRYKKKQGESVTQKLRKQQWFILFALFHGKLSFVP